MPKWPKQLPPLSPEDQRVNDDFMEHWHDVFPNKYGIADRWSHSYPARHRPAQFLRTLEIGAGLGEHLKYEVLTAEQEKNYVAVEYRANMAKRLHEACPKIQTYLGDCQQRARETERLLDEATLVMSGLTAEYDSIGPWARSCRCRTCPGMITARTAGGHTDRNPRAGREDEESQMAGHLPPLRRRNSPGSARRPGR